MSKRTFLLSYLLAVVCDVIHPLMGLPNQPFLTGRIFPSCEYSHTIQLGEFSHLDEERKIMNSKSCVEPKLVSMWPIMNMFPKHMSLNILRGGGGALGGREIKVKAVKKKHVASNPKSKSETDGGKSDGLSRSQRRKVKDTARAERSAAAGKNEPVLSALEEAAEIAAKAAKRKTKVNPGLHSAFEQLSLMDENNSEANEEPQSQSAEPAIETKVSKQNLRLIAP
jgi:hypothetical protein